MELTATEDIGGERLVYTLTIPRADYMKFKPTTFDQALLDDIESGKPSNTPMADKLLGLETIVKRIEEANSKEQL